VAPVQKHWKMVEEPVRDVALSGQNEQLVVLVWFWYVPTGHAVQLARETALVSAL
jgi:hypothetical protein